MYRASAGSGKTFQLTRHYLELLLRDTDNYKKILAVTFTNKAAGELKKRVIDELVIISGPDPYKSDHFTYLVDILNKEEDLLNKRARKILGKILEDYGHFSIGTIDHFFQKVLRSFSREVGINNGYRLELNADAFLRGSIDLLMNDLDEDKVLLSWLSRWVDDRILNDKKWSYIERELISIGQEFMKEKLMEMMDEEWVKKYSEESILNFAVKLKSIEKEFADDLKGIRDEAAGLLERFGLDATDFKMKGRSIPAHLVAISEDKKFLGRKVPDKGINNPEEWYAKTHSEDERQRILNALDSGLHELLIRYVDIRREKEPVYTSALLIGQNLFALGLSAKIMHYINRYSDQSNSLLINLTSPIISSIIADNPSPFIYEKVGGYFDHFMIDEFQDTSNLQWSNFRPLITNSLAQNDFSMVVGDVKQSIFRWRNSNWKLMAFKAERDMKMFGTEKRVLDQNWRSRDNIIDFNNLFFSSANSIVVNRIKEEFGDQNLNGEGIDPENILDVYSDSVQKKGAGKPGGYFEANFENEEDGEAWAEKVPRLIEDLQLVHHYKPEDITLLVRYNFQAGDLVKAIQAYRDKTGGKEGCSYDIISSESYRLRNSPSVRLVIWALRYVLYPGETYFMARLAQEYISLKRIYVSEKENDKISALGKNPDLLRELVPEEIIDNRNTYSFASAGSLIEELIRIFHLQDDVDEIPYLMTLRDKVLDGIGARTTLEEISLWWDEEGFNVSVPMTEQPGAMRVVTIHKAKGLEYKVVILPYCDWNLDHIPRNSMIWVDTKDSPFSDVPLVPVILGKSMAQSSLSSFYYEEKMQVYLDNLNLVYVAFTRAIERLYTFSVLPSNSSGYPVGKLIRDVFPDELKDSDWFCFGDENTIPGGQEKGGDYSRFSYKPYQARPYTSISGLRQSVETEAIHYGRVMHEILELTETVDDLKNSAEVMIHRGELSREKSGELIEHLDKLLRRPDIADWFNGENKVHREKSLLVPGRGTIRPDRVVETGDGLVIIDYKFGEHRSSHENQLNFYKSSFLKMGYENVKAFLLYPEAGELVEVS